MAIPIIVLGAGASHNYSHYGTPPPLTNHLVDSEFLDLDIVKKYTEAASLFSEIAPQVIEQKKSFEEVLTLIKKDLGHHAHRRQQFVALQFYLKDYFEKLSGNFQNINNYRTLISKIHDYSNGQACLVTFNYDTLLEQSIGYDRFDSLRSYIDTSPHVVKLHGSHDWVYIGQKNSLTVDEEYFPIKSSFDYLKTNPDYLDNIRERGANPFHIRELSRSSEYGKVIQFPAIAVPVTDKQNFLCPINHIELLRRNLGQTDRLLVIGWKAGDSDFTQFIKDYLNPKALLTVVSGTIESAEEISKRLNEIKTFASSRAYGGGFSGFVSSDYCQEFFTRNIETT